MPDIQTELQKVVGAKDDMPATQRVVPQAKPAVQADAPKKITRQRINGSVAPLVTLVHMLGSNVAAAKAVGLTASGIATVISHGACSKSVEIAATLVIKEIERRREGGAAPADMVYLLRVPADKRDAVAAVTHAMGLDLMDIGGMLR